MINQAKIGPEAEPAAPLKGSSPSMAEAEGKRDEFREAMRQDPGNDKPEGENETGRPGVEYSNKTTARDEKGEAAAIPPPFSGDALLHSLGASFVPLETQAVAPALTQDTSSLATELAERILVNVDNRAAGGEVRISLKDAVLPDTEIILHQEGERLLVQLASGNPASLEVLRLTQNDLRNKLLALGQDISVEVLDNRDQEDGDRSRHSGGRSRGLDYFTESEG